MTEEAAVVIPQGSTYEDIAKAFKVDIVFIPHFTNHSECSQDASLREWQDKKEIITGLMLNFAERVRDGKIFEPRLLIHLFDHIAAIDADPFKITKKSYQISYRETFCGKGSV